MRGCEDRTPWTAPGRMLTVAIVLCGIPVVVWGADTLRVPCRSRLVLVKGSDDWVEVMVPVEMEPAKTAILICDMWDRHWCDTATARVNVLAQRMNPVLEAARARGMLIVHAPSDTMSFYEEHPARRRAIEAAPVEVPKDRLIAEPPLPIDDSDGGCDGSHAVPVNTSVWTRQHPAIRIDDADLISDSGPEIFRTLMARGIENLVFMGVHTNMCVLGRSFGIRQMTRWGLRTILVRDLTDTMYNPARRPFVAHDRGTELVVEHIERYWCPTVASEEFMEACAR